MATTTTTALPSAADAASPVSVLADASSSAPKHREATQDAFKASPSPPRKQLHLLGEECNALGSQSDSDTAQGHGKSDKSGVDVGILRRCNGKGERCVRDGSSSIGGRCTTPGSTAARVPPTPTEEKERQRNLLLRENAHSHHFKRQSRNQDASSSNAFPPPATTATDVSNCYIAMAYACQVYCPYSTCYAVIDEGSDATAEDCNCFFAQSACNLYRQPAYGNYRFPNCEVAGCCNYLLPGSRAGCFLKGCIAPLAAVATRPPQTLPPVEETTSPSRASVTPTLSNQAPVTDTPVSHAPTSATVPTSQLSSTQLPTSTISLIPLPTPMEPAPSAPGSPATTAEGRSAGYSVGSGGSRRGVAVAAAVVIAWLSGNCRG